jgi:Na+-transporting NADH:ubiquinone oxidoreductase subunit NqrC
MNGNVAVTAVVTAQGVVAYLTIDASCEDINFGQQVMSPKYVEQFVGKTLPLTLGEHVDAVSGATITSQAVVDALNLLTPQYATPHDNLPAAE